VLGLALAAGCGSGGERVLGMNSRTEVYLESPDIDSLELIVSPSRGGPNVTNACDDTGNGFGCEQEFDFRSTLYRFTTNSQASTQPYYVYVRNRRNAEVDFFMVITMDDMGDDKEKVRFTARLVPLATALVAQVHRNNACEDGIDCP